MVSLRLYDVRSLSVVTNKNTREGKVIKIIRINILRGKIIANYCRALDKVICEMGLFNLLILKRADSKI